MNEEAVMWFNALVLVVTLLAAAVMIWSLTGPEAQRVRARRRRGIELPRPTTWRGWLYGKDWPPEKSR